MLGSAAEILLQLMDAALYSVGAFKRFRGQGYTFVIPKEWVADTAVELAKVQRRAGTLDYRMSRGREGGTLPDAGENKTVNNVNNVCCISH